MGGSAGGAGAVATALATGKPIDYDQLRNQILAGALQGGAFAAGRLAGKLCVQVRQEIGDVGRVVPQVMAAVSRSGTHVDKGRIAVGDVADRPLAGPGQITVDAGAEHPAAGVLDLAAEHEDEVVGQQAAAGQLARDVVELPGAAHLRPPLWVPADVGQGGVHRRRVRGQLPLGAEDVAIRRPHRLSMRLVSQSPGTPASPRA